ncbi:MAG: MarR family winged helix-turn-helix transcriptional regulator [Hyphomonadaceae bacterium]|nr:MarR family winged helix-turn-helix transcriptional regulator [Hyphomonadaceae bacterium]
MSVRSEDALIALRQIQRKTEQASKKLAAQASLTPSQLLVMQILAERGEISAGEVSKLTQLKHATITSLVDKLVARGLATRRRCEEDRRRVWLTILPEGQNAITSAPDLLQETFQTRFETLPDWHQAMLVSSLERVAALLDAEDLEAAPILDVGALDERP